MAPCAAGSALSDGSAFMSELPAAAPAVPDASEAVEDRCRFVLPPLYLQMKGVHFTTLYVK